MAETNLRGYSIDGRLNKMDIDLIDVSLLTIQEKNWLNNYHETVYLNLYQKLDSNEAKWLLEVTKPL